MGEKIVVVKLSLPRELLEKAYREIQLNKNKSSVQKCAVAK